MSKKPVYDVAPREGGWEVKKEGSARASSLHDTKADAVKRGRELAEEAAGQLRIKGRDGKVQEERTYRDDPYPPRG